MPKNPVGRSVLSVPPSPYRRSLRASLMLGNGKPPDPSAEGRLAHMEELLEKLQDALETQFARTAAIQAELDHLKATITR